MSGQKKTRIGRQRGKKQDKFYDTEIWMENNEEYSLLQDIFLERVEEYNELTDGSPEWIELERQLSRVTLGQIMFLHFDLYTNDSRSNSWATHLASPITRYTSDELTVKIKVFLDVILRMYNKTFHEGKILRFIQELNNKIVTNGIVNKCEGMNLTAVAVLTQIIASLPIAENRKTLQLADFSAYGTQDRQGITLPNVDDVAMTIQKKESVKRLIASIQARENEAMRMRRKIKSGGQSLVHDGQMLTYIEMAILVDLFNLIGLLDRRSVEGSKGLEVDACIKTMIAALAKPVKPIMDDGGAENCLSLIKKNVIACHLKTNIQFTVGVILELYEAISR